MEDLTHSAGENAIPEARGRRNDLSPNWPYPSDYGLGLVCIHSLDGRLLSVSPAGAKALGYEPQEMVGREMRDFLPEDVRDQLQAYLDHIRQHGIASGLMRVTTKQGEERILAYSNICRQEPGKSAYVLGHAADITELKKAEQRLRAAEQRFRSLLQCSSDVVTIAKEDGSIEYVSPAVQRALGYSPQEVVGRNIFDYVHPEDVSLARTTFEAALQTPGYTIPTEIRVINAGGAYVHFEVTTNNLLRTPGVGGVVLAARDLSGRKLAEREFQKQQEEFEKRDRERSAELAGANRMLKAEIKERELTEKALRESQSLLQAALESTADGILVVGMNGKIVSSNRRFSAMWGLPEDVIDRQSDREALQFVLDQLKSPGDFLSKVNELYETPEKSSYDVLEFRDGRVFERYSQPQKIAGKTVGRVWSFRDATERKRLEEHLLQAQKMEAIGRLAGGVAHDFNNLLMVILGHCKELTSRPGAVADPARHSIEEILAAADRAASLTRQLLAFSRRQVLAPRVLDVNLVLSELTMMLRRLIGEDIELLIALSDSPAYVEADPGQLDQVIINLVVNARDAMPKGGRLTVHARPLTLPQDLVRSTGSVPRGEYVLITVADTGIGISKETLPRIFEPFFTTKQVGQGTGLGLATAYGFVRQSRGHIHVESESGRGTTFEIYLPRLEAPLAAAPAPDLAAAPLGGSETILLVEDEAGIRVLTKTFLQQQGYTVLEARDGLEALSLAKDYSEPIHLLLTDVVMPGIRGTEVAERLLKQRPNVRILYVSGYPAEEMNLPTAALLQKPFPMEELGAKIRQVLDNNRTSAA